MFQRHPACRREGTHQGNVGPDKLLSETSTYKFLATNQENIFGANCLSRRWMQQGSMFTVIFSTFSCGLLTHTCTHAHRMVTNYSNSVMRFLTLSPMLPLPLILCYINYIFNKPTQFLWCQHQVSMATAGWSQLSGMHTHTHTLCCLLKTLLQRCSVDKMSKSTVKKKNQTIL